MLINRIDHEEAQKLIWVRLNRVQPRQHIIEPPISTIISPLRIATFRIFDRNILIDSVSATHLASWKWTPRARAPALHRYEIRKESTSLCVLEEYRCH